MKCHVFEKLFLNLILKITFVWETKSTWGTPILRHASRKFSTFRRHLAIVSLGWKERKKIWNCMYSYAQTHTYTKTYKCSYEQNKCQSHLPLPVRVHGCSVWIGDARGWPDGTTRPRQSKLPQDHWVKTPWVYTRYSAWGMQNFFYIFLGNIFIWIIYAKRIS